MKSSTLGGRGQSGDHRGTSQLSPASRRRRTTTGGVSVPKIWSWVRSLAASSGGADVYAG